MYFMVAWLPYYLQRERGLSSTAMPLVAAAYYACDALAALSTGYVTDFLVRSGRPVTNVRKFSMALGSALAAVTLVGCALAGPHTYLFWFMSLGICSGISGWGVLSFAQSLAGPGAAGKWTGLQNGFANFAGVFSPMITGFLVHWTGRFSAPLGLAAGVALFGALAWTRVSGRDAESSPVPASAQELALPVSPRSA
jgi:cyanate permease